MSLSIGEAWGGGLDKARTGPYDGPARARARAGGGDTRPGAPQERGEAGPFVVPAFVATAASLSAGWPPVRRPAAVLCVP